MPEVHHHHPGTVDPATGLPHAPYIFTSSGVNGQGNSWWRLATASGHGYRYLNTDGSVYFRGSDGAAYYYNGRGFYRYTSPTGEATIWFA